MPSTRTLSALLSFALLVLFMAIQGVVPAIGGQAMPSVSGKWQGAWSTRGGNSGQITLQLVQEGNKVIGKQNVVDFVPVWGTQQAPMVIGEEVRDGEIDGSTLHFHVTAENVQGQLNFTLTVSGDTMTGTICGYNCAKVKLQKAKM